MDIHVDFLKSREIETHCLQGLIFIGLIKNRNRSQYNNNDVCTIEKLK